MGHNRICPFCQEPFYEINWPDAETVKRFEDKEEVIICCRECDPDGYRPKEDED